MTRQLAPHPQPNQSLGKRARDAAAFIAHGRTRSPYGPWRGAAMATVAIRLAGLLGLEPEAIDVHPDHLRRRTLPGEPVIATATCPTTGSHYSFLLRDCAFHDEPFELLDACPECGGAVPVATIGHLADLGSALADSLTASYPDDFHNDEAHTSRCRYGPMP
ncbi:hypothetical protein [Streptomyces boninensis]|uniref:hypothetical protein n=1 Tax=Streptomyces boninensis TaxID=2039455 RepID=UPI003B225D22